MKNTLTTNSHSKTLKPFIDKSLTLTTSDASTLVTKSPSKTLEPFIGQVLTLVTNKLFQILKGKKLAAFLRPNAIAIFTASRTKKPFQTHPLVQTQSPPIETMTAGFAHCGRSWY